MKTHILLIACLGIYLVPAWISANELFCAFWNVENLFDTADDPDVVGDEVYTPQSSKKWTRDRLNIKLNNLGRVIKDMNGGRGPDVFGLGEVENRGVVELLVEKLSSLGRDYQIIHKDSPSDRGIDCAMLFDAKKLKLIASDFLFVDADNTRDIVQGEFTIDGRRFYVFVNHWPSRFNPEEARVTAARTLRLRLNRILEGNREADILIMGDLNDMPTNRSVAKVLRTWSDPKSLYPGVFFNSTFPLHADAERGTYVYRNKWQLVDHVILSPGMLDRRGLSWKPGSTKAVLNDYQMFVPDRKDWLARPSRSYTSNTFHDDGCSDHLPISCVLQLE